MLFSNADPMTTLALLACLMTPMDDTSSVPVVVSVHAVPFAGRSMAVSASGDLLCLSARDVTVSVFRPDLSVRGSLGGRGWGNTEFDRPTDVSSSFLLNVYVADPLNRRLQQFDRDLNFVQSLDARTLQPMEGELRPRAAAVISNGDVYVIDEGERRIVAAGRRGRVEREFGSVRDDRAGLTDPRDIAASADDRLFVLDRYRVVVFDQFGSIDTVLPLGPAPWKSLSVSGITLLITADDRIQAMSLDGSSPRTFHRDLMAGVGSDEVLMDAALSGGAMYVLTDRSLHRCELR